MHRKYRAYEPGILELVLEIAWASPITGAIISIVFLIIGDVLRSIEYAPGTAWMFAGPILGLLSILVGWLGLLVSAIALFRDELFGR